MAPSVGHRHRRDLHRLMKHSTDRCLRDRKPNEWKSDGDAERRNESVEGPMDGTPRHESFQVERNTSWSASPSIGLDTFTKGERVGGKRQLTQQ